MSKTLEEYRIAEIEEPEDAELIDFELFIQQHYPQIKVLSNLPIIFINRLRLTILFDDLCNYFEGKTITLRCDIGKSDYKFTIKSGYSCSKSNTLELVKNVLAFYESSLIDQSANSVVFSLQIFSQYKNAI